MVTVAVHGARGYLGRECVRALLAHPRVSSVVPVSATQAGSRYGSQVHAYAHLPLTFASAQDAAVVDADVAILATDADDAKILAPSSLDAGQLVIDLSRAHRHEGLAGKGGWTYGLPEIPPGLGKGVRQIANPGCYPTATLLAAGPALLSGLVTEGPLIADCKSGLSGAGATPRADLHYAEAHDSVRAYKVLAHDHLAEIRGSAARVEGRSIPRPVRFTPHLVPQNRGLLATVYLPIEAGTTTEDLHASYQKVYAGAHFVRLVQEPDTATVRGSNFADVRVDVDADAGLLVARCAIDNLVKGGAGQAIQNMNLALGLPETAGLTAIGGGP